MIIHVGVNMQPLDGTSVGFSRGNYRHDTVFRQRQYLLSGQQAQLEKGKILSRLEESFCRESQNHKMTEFGRDLRSSLLLKACPPV